MSFQLALAYDSSQDGWLNQITLTDDADTNAVWKQIIQLTSLSENWDSYGGIPPTAEALEGALGISRAILTGNNLPRPSVVPVPNGSIQLEWSCFGLDIEIEIESQTSIQFYFSDLINGNEFEDHFEYDLREISKRMQILEVRFSEATQRRTA